MLMSVSSHLYAEDRIRPGVYAGTPALQCGETTLFFHDERKIREAITALQDLEVRSSSEQLPAAEVVEESDIWPLDMAEIEHVDLESTAILKA